MPGKLVITLDANHRVNIENELQGQELYQAMAAFSAYLATRLKNPNDIKRMMNQATEDALKLLQKNTSMKN